MLLNKEGDLKTARDLGLDWISEQGRREGGEEGEVLKDNNVFVCVLGREKIGGGGREEKEKAIVVIMIPSGSEGRAEYAEGRGQREREKERVGDLQSDNRPRL